MKTQFSPIALLTLLILSTPITLAADFQSHESIHSAARAFIDSALAADTEHEITLAPLDARLQLSPCEQPLEAAISTPTLKPGRNSISVKCNGAKSWALYVSAQVKIYQDVVTLKQAAQRGEILTANHVQLNRMDISQLRSPFIRDLSSAINKQAAHNLSQDAILSERDVALAIIIKRGASVAISSANHSISIQMQGQALMDGTQGQSIRVKNTTSGRVITGIVTKPGVVAVDL